MADVITEEIAPTFDILDKFKGTATQATAGSGKKGGHSARHLIGQAKLREVHSTWLAALIGESNRLAVSQGKLQYYIVLDPEHVDARYLTKAKKLVGNPRLSEIQAINLDLNLELCAMGNELKPEDTPTPKGKTDDSDIF